MVLLVLMASWKSHDWKSVGPAFGFLAFWMVWIASFRLTVDDRELTYQSLFGGKKAIALADISEAKIAVGMKDAFGPFFRLTLYPPHESMSQPIVINLKVFGREDLKELFAVLGLKIE
jgi:hypothetical protein